jgi:DNA-binding CsgD family transcriptional regulator
MRHMTGMSENVVAEVLFAAVGLIVLVDLLSDVGAGVERVHVGLEGLAAIVAAAGAARFFGRYQAERREAAAWKSKAGELLEGLGAAVDRQFATWALTAAERKVALLLLKGLSFKEVASVRGTSERTSREQARGVYKKAGVGGRAELSAWFFEDLLAPAEGVAGR